MAHLTFRSGATLLTTLTVAIALSSCGDDGNDTPASADVPDGTVAVVDGVEISKDSFDGQVAALKRVRQSGDSSMGDKQLESQALSLLLYREALEAEAADRDITVTRAEVRQRWETSAKSQFKTAKARKRFLGGQTEQDLLEQLRTQLLIERIHQQVNDDVGGAKKGAKAVEEFQKEFQKRLQDDVACAKGYEALGCNENKSK
jgi:hypothetical protein